MYNIIKQYKNILFLSFNEQMWQDYWNIESNKKINYNEKEIIENVWKNPNLKEAISKKLSKENIINKIKKNWIEKKEEQNKTEIKLEMKIKSENPINIIDIIENKKEFILMYQELWDVLMNSIYITKEKISKIQKNWPKNLKEQLILSFAKNPEKFKGLDTILDGINRNWLQNIFIKEKINFTKIIQNLKIKSEKKFKNTEHIPDDEKKFLNAIKKYYY